MNNTSETEANLIKSVGFGELTAGLVTAEFSRKLERERDDARVLLNVMEQSLHAALYREGELKRERDEAILQLGAIQSACAEELELPSTPTTADKVRQALRSLISFVKPVVDKTNKETLKMNNEVTPLQSAYQNTGTAKEEIEYARDALIETRCGDAIMWIDSAMAQLRNARIKIGRHIAESGVAEWEMEQ